MAFGTFDILHPGHISYLREASRHGKLIVVVSRDRSVMRIKHRKPVFGQSSRLATVAALRFVHRAVLGGTARKPTDMYRIILKFRPDTLVFGYDQKADLPRIREFLEKNGIRPKIIRAKPFNKNYYKSSKLARRIVQNL
jgi:FAD synthetase